MSQGIVNVVVSVVVLAIIVKAVHYFWRKNKAKNILNHVAKSTLLHDLIKSRKLTVDILNVHYTGFFRAEEYAIDCMKKDGMGQTLGHLAILLGGSLEIIEWLITHYPVVLREINGTYPPIEYKYVLEKINPFTLQVCLDKNHYWNNEDKQILSLLNGKTMLELAYIKNRSDIVEYCRMFFRANSQKQLVPSAPPMHSYHDLKPSTSLHRIGYISNLTPAQALLYYPQTEVQSLYPVQYPQPSFSNPYP